MSALDSITEVTPLRPSIRYINIIQKLLCIKYSVGVLQSVMLVPREAPLDDE